MASDISAQSVSSMTLPVRTSKSRTKSTGSACNSSSHSEMPVKDRRVSVVSNKSNPMGQDCDRRTSVLSNAGMTSTQLFRRRSTLNLMPGMTSLLRLRKLTLADTKVDNKPKTKYENTFKMEPDNNFMENKVHELVGEILKEDIGDQTYHQAICGQMALDMSSKIKNKVKALNLPRYRVVCQVIVGEIKQQGIEAASRSIWTPKTDNYTTVTYANKSIFAVAMVHAIYLE